MRKLQLVAVMVGLLLVAPVGAYGQDNGADTYRQLKLFSDVFERVRAGYVEEVTDKELIEFAIHPTSIFNFSKHRRAEMTA
jgi:carboxyl-terminal processing protease